ncbi:hypothetical protein GX586_06280 [bacterium]|nr:hypothetical protein [bacterium]
MNASSLPTGDGPHPLAFPHFPTRQQAFVWRNWELVPPARLARILGCRRGDVLDLARGMGLRVPPRLSREWISRGYCTLIRNNWHLLPYSQLLELLGWTAGQMDYTLREDDFLFVKLGNHKPAAAPVRFEPLTPGQTRQTEALRAAVARHCTVDARAQRMEKPFGFLRAFRNDSKAARAAATQNAFDLRLMYSYAAAYGDPLRDSRSDPYPDGMLARYAAEGVNAVWLQGILYTLVPWDAFPALSAGCETRLANLRALVERAARHGIGVYLYFNEPRALPVDCFADRPELKNYVFEKLGLANLCTSQPEVQQFLRAGAEHVFREVPGLAGIFTITMNENPTNCYSRWHSSKACPRCSNRRAADVIAEVNRLLAEGVHAANPAARVLVWTWGWQPEWDLEAVDLLPDGVELMCVSEWGLPTHVGGVDGSVVDYSISRVGPSEQSLRLWRRAQARGLKTVAKVQVNTSWELSAVPYLHVPDLVEQHLGNLRQAGVNGLMLSWTVGGYPGGNLALLNHSSAELAVMRFGRKAAPLIQQAWRAFGTAFQEFPFDCGVLYRSPVNTGPANLLHLRPTGHTATMVQGFPYDDLKKWRNIYPEDVFEEQFRLLSDGWRHGLEMLERARPLVPKAKRNHFDDLDHVARAAYCHYRSTCLQIRFVRTRDSGMPSAEQTAIMLPLLDEEIDLARTLHGIMQRDSRIGFEAANHYSYTRNDLVEKMVQCEWLRERLSSPPGAA